MATTTLGLKYEHWSSDSTYSRFGWETEFFIPQYRMIITESGGVILSDLPRNQHSDIQLYTRLWRQLHENTDLDLIYKLSLIQVPLIEVQIETQYVLNCFTNLMQVAYQTNESTQSGLPKQCL